MAGENRLWLMAYDLLTKTGLSLFVLSALLFSDAAGGRRGFAFRQDSLPQSFIV